MLWILTRKELLTHVMTARLGLAVVFSVVLTAVATSIGSLEYSENHDNYERRARDARERLDAAVTWSQVNSAGPKAVVPPQPLGILARGLAGTAPLTIWFSVDEVPVTAWVSASGGWNRFLKVIAEIDFTMVVALLLSFLAVVLGFDGLSGERERGTLRLLLSHPVPRSQVVLAKLLGGWLSLWVPLILAYGISIAIIGANPDVVMGSQDWVRMGLFLALSALFLAQIYSLSLMVSACVDSSSTSLIVCLFIWLVSGIGFVNLMPSFSRYGVYEKPSQQFRDARSRLQQELSDQIAAWEAAHPPPGRAWMEGIESRGVHRFVHPQGMAWMVARNEHVIDKQLEYADAWYKWWPEALATEARLVDAWSILSPITNYQTLAYQIARTTFDDTFLMGEAARAYRETWLEYLRSRRAFSSDRWFTDDPPGQEPLFPDPASTTAEMLDPDAPFMQRRLAWAQEELRLRPRGQLDLTGMPGLDVGSEQRSIAESIGAMVPGLLVLFLTLGISVLVTLLRFDRSQLH